MEVEIVAGEDLLLHEEVEKARDAGGCHDTPIRAELVKQGGKLLTGPGAARLPLEVVSDVSAGSLK